MLPESRRPSRLEAIIVFILSALLVVTVCLVSLRSVFLVLEILLNNAIFNILKNWKNQ
jgi:hypothetical protein